VRWSARTGAAPARWEFGKFDLRAQATFSELLVPSEPGHHCAAVVEGAGPPDAPAVKTPDPTQRSADLPPDAPPAVAAAWLRRFEAGLRLGLGASWLALCTTAWGNAAYFEWWRPALAVVALFLLSARAPRATAFAAWSIAAWGWHWSGWSPSGAGLAAWLTGASAFTLGFHCSGAGGWLRRVWYWERQRRLALVATGLFAGSGETPLAGRVYEFEGLARRELAACGAEPARWAAPLRPAAQAAGQLTARIPGLGGLGSWIAARLSAHLERSFG
jgi:hypothetical protein